MSQSQRDQVIITWDPELTTAQRDVKESYLLETGACLERKNSDGLIRDIGG